MPAAGGQLATTSCQQCITRRGSKGSQCTCQRPEVMRPCPDVGEQQGSPLNMQKANVRVMQVVPLPPSVCRSRHRQGINWTFARAHQYNAHHVACNWLELLLVHGQNCESCKLCNHGLATRKRIAHSVCACPSSFPTQVRVLTCRSTWEIASGQPDKTRPNHAGQTPTANGLCCKWEARGRPRTLDGCNCDDDDDGR